MHTIGVLTTAACRLNPICSISVCGLSAAALRSAPPRAVRQMVTARDERRPLYLNTQGYSVGVSSEVLQVKEKGKVVQKIRLNDVSHVNLFGAVQVSTQAIQVLLRRRFL
ncbi:MAG: CRISPR-associated endonuclease Cas1 [Pirellulaceae bacterium]